MLNTYKKRKDIKCYLQRNHNMYKSGQGDEYVPLSYIFGETTTVSHGSKNVS